MDRYRISQERYKELRKLCGDPDYEEMIDEALEQIDDWIAPWIKRHVTSKRWRWRHMERAGIPCGGDTFRLHRAKFYYHLDMIQKRGEQKAMTEEYNDDS